MQDSIAVANYFIKKSNDSGDYMTTMKLLKLVYIAHGWHLALADGEPLIGEKIEAWKLGPVIPSVYREFRSTGNITDFGTIGASKGFGISIPKVEDQDIIKLLDKIWEVYGKLNGMQLSTITHQEGTPWSEVWNPTIRHIEIPNELIRKHYEHIMSKNSKTTSI